MAKLTIREPNRELREVWTNSADELELVISHGENGDHAYCYAMLYQLVSEPRKSDKPGEVWRQPLASASLPFPEGNTGEVVASLQRMLLIASADRLTIMHREEGHT